MSRALPLNYLAHQGAQAPIPRPKGLGAAALVATKFGAAALVYIVGVTAEFLELHCWSFACIRYRRLGWCVYFKPIFDVQAVRSQRNHGGTGWMRPQPGPFCNSIAKPQASQAQGLLQCFCQALCARCVYPSVPAHALRGCCCAFPAEKASLSPNPFMSMSQRCTILNLLTMVSTSAAMGTMTTWVCLG